MELRIGNFIVNSDVRSYTLLEVTGVSDKTGLETTRNLGYFMTLEGVLQKMCKVVQADAEIKTLAALEAAMQRFMLEVAQAFSK